jgi:catechol 2,3-dioxygenase-like lactoylglutathione lyase family enzyme
MQFAHMHLMVEDLDRSIEFYVTNLGFRDSGRQIIETGRFITDHWMEAGTEIAFVRDADGAELALEKASVVHPLPPWFHFGFLLHSPQAVEELYQKMKIQGVRLRKLSREGECVGFRCYDPDGYLLEFCHEPGRERDPGAIKGVEKVKHG